MNKSIEISGKTIIYIVTTVLVFVGIIFFINSYDNNEKLKQLKVTLNELKKSNFDKINSILLTTNLDSLSTSELEGLKNNLTSLKANVDLNGIDLYSANILISANSNYYKIGYYDLQHFNSNFKSYSSLIKPVVLSKKEEELIKLLEGEHVDLNKIILDEFSFLDANRIIYPIGSNATRKLYYRFSYRENS